VAKGGCTRSRINMDMKNYMLSRKYRALYKKTLFYQVRQVAKRVHLLKKEMRKTFPARMMIKLLDWLVKKED